MTDFEERFDALTPIAYRVAYRLLGDHDESVDIAQEALTRAYVRWRTIAAYDEAWVARVSANLALGHLRRKKPDLAQLLTGQPDRAETVTLRLVLANGLRRLPRRQRDVVVLRYLADLPEATVANLLGCSPGTVKSHAHRGLAALRETLGPIGSLPEGDHA